MLVVPTGKVTYPHYIINFPTKRHWKGKARLADIDSGLAALIAEVERLGITSIAVPPLGCGNGGLDWRDVRPMIERAFASTPQVRVQLYEPAGAPEAARMPVATARPKMTPGRAAVVALLETYFQPGYRATMLERPGLQEALADARKGRFDLLLVFRVDRLARSVRSLAMILEELDQLNVAFRSATEPFDTSSPAGRMMVQMLGVFAEFERATLIERVLAGMEKKAAKGGWNGGTRPLGYEYDPETGCLVVNDAEAPVVRKIFELYTSGMWGSASIARWLNDQGHRTKKGALWTAKTVRNLLSNSVYIGDVFFRGSTHPGKHPALIEPEVFERTQQILAERGEEAKKRRTNTTEYLLTATLFCDRCGGRFIGIASNGNGGAYRYYTCKTRLKYGPQECDQERLPALDLELAVVKHLIACLRDKGLIGQAVERVQAEWDDTRPQQWEELTAVEQELRQGKATVDKYPRAFETGAMSPETCGERLPDLRERLAALEARRIELTDALQTEPARPDLKTVLRTAGDLARELEGEELPRTKNVLSRLIEQLRIESRATIRAVFRVPLVSTTPRWVDPAPINSNHRDPASVAAPDLDVPWSDARQDLETRVEHARRTKHLHRDDSYHRAALRGLAKGRRQRDWSDNAILTAIQDFHAAPTAGPASTTSARRTAYLGWERSGGGTDRTCSPCARLSGARRPSL